MSGHGWTFTLFIIALVAGILGFTGIDASMAVTARMVFFVSVVLAAIAALVEHQPSQGR